MYNARTIDIKTAEIAVCSIKGGHRKQTSPGHFLFADIILSVAVIKLASAFDELLSILHEASASVRDRTGPNNVRILIIRSADSLWFH